MKAGNLNQLSFWTFAFCGAWLVILGLYFIFIRALLLPEDLRFLGVTSTEIQEHLPRLSLWLDHVFTVMGGFIAGCGILILFITKTVLRERSTSAIFALGISGLSTVGVMSWINFLIDSHFKWLLLIPALLWLGGFLSYSFNKKPSL